MKELLKKVAGGVFIVTGVASGWLPLIPGILLILLGLELLGLREKCVARYTSWRRNHRKSDTT